MPRKEREIELGEKAKRFTNVYVKNFNEAMTEEDLSKMFEKFGKITSLKVNIVNNTLRNFHTIKVFASSNPPEFLSITYPCSIDQCCFALKHETHTFAILLDQKDPTSPSCQSISGSMVDLI